MSPLILNNILLQKNLSLWPKQVLASLIIVLVFIENKFIALLLESFFIRMKLNTLPKVFF